MKSYLWVLAALFLLIYIFPLGQRPLITPDETRYGQIAREMIDSGDWVVPHLLGVRYFEKPVMGYWFNAVSMLIFGQNGFGVRFSSAAATGLSALLIYFFMRRFWKKYDSVFLPPLMFLTFGMVYFIGTFAVLDSVTTMFITGTMVFFFFGYSEKNGTGKKILYLILAGVCCGGAFLTKGFLAFAVPAVSIAPFLIREKRWKDLLVLPWLPLLAATVVALPWCIMVHLREPDFWHYFFWVEHVERFVGRNETQHPEPFWFYLPIFAGGAAPWVLLVGCLWCKGLWAWGRNFIKDPVAGFILCWLIFPFIFFSACGGKLATYILPCFAPLAILSGIILTEAAHRDNGRIFNFIVAWLAIVLAAGAVGLAIFQIFADADYFPGLFRDNERNRWILLVAAILLWAALLYQAFLMPRINKKLLLFGVSPVFVYFVANIAIPGWVLESKAQELYLGQFRRRITSDTVIVAHPNVMHAVAWEYRRPDILLYSHEGELEYGFKYPGVKEKRLIKKNQLAELIKRTPKGKLVFIMREDSRPKIPKAEFEVLDHEIMFANF